MIAALLLAASLLFAGGADYSPKQVAAFKARVARLAPAKRDALHRWLTWASFAKWIRGLPVQGTPPQWVCWRESRCTYAAFNATGCGGNTCVGKWQFDTTTWDATARRMGRGDLVGDYFPADVKDQDRVAAFLWAGGAGCGHWAAC